MTNTKGYDLIIIGAGPAGLTAAIYAVRSGLKTAVVSKDIGGATSKILMLENWPGFEGTGTQLMVKIYAQVKKYDVDFFMDSVEQISKSKNGFLVKTVKNKIECKSVIITTGAERRKLNIKGEEELVGKGVSYCVTCDGFFFKDKVVGVVGGSNCAANSALALSDTAKKVYVFYRGEELRCEKVNLERLKEKKNVEIIYNAISKEILGKEKVEQIKILIDEKEKDFDVDGVFVEIGAIPITNFREGLSLKLNKDKEIIVNENMETSVKGIYAAGDVTNQKLKQVVVASGQGAIAAKSAYNWISKRK